MNHIRRRDVEVIHTELEELRQQDDYNSLKEYLNIILANEEIYWKQMIKNILVKGE